ncbi:unnamed protein product [Cuscuta campestris]|uniref:DDE Tnp4 domain-containing protein n=1 Tax=Cuscuta campestris TaxID=132261 RepID=A0A484NBA9_9ASTE|nr:unnamed protein product [Cuscuta campestris]
MAPLRGLKKRRKVEKKGEDEEEVIAARDGSTDWWALLSKRVSGSVSPSKGMDNFQSMFKMSRTTFEYICTLVKDQMMPKSATHHLLFTNGKPMSLHEQVALAVRRLCSGNSLIVVGESFGAHHSTVSQVTWRFVEAVEEAGAHHLRWPSSNPEMDRVKSKFEQIRGLPNCCGAIDTTHVTMLVSSTERTADVWVDEMGNHSMVLQAIVDPEMRFRDIVTGLPGKMDNASVLQTSVFFKLCKKGKRLNGKKVKLFGEAEVGEYIVGDSGFPLCPWVMTPYHGQELSGPKAEFNKKLYATRVVARRALARLKGVWKMIQGNMWRPDKHKLPRFILVCCILHNIIIDMEDEVLDDEMPLPRHHDRGYPKQVSEPVDEASSVMRDHMSAYLYGKKLHS